MRALKDIAPEETGTTWISPGFAVDEHHVDFDAIESEHAGFDTNKDVEEPEQRGLLVKNEELSVERIEQLLRTYLEEDICALAASTPRGQTEDDSPLGRQLSEHMLTADGEAVEVVETWGGNGLSADRTGFRPVSDQCHVGCKVRATVVHSVMSSDAQTVMPPCHVRSAESTCRICGVSCRMHWNVLTEIQEN